MGKTPKKWGFLGGRRWAITKKPGFPGVFRGGEASGGGVRPVFGGVRPPSEGGSGRPGGGFSGGGRPAGGPWPGGVWRGGLAGGFSGGVFWGWMGGQGDYFSQAGSRV